MTHKILAVALVAQVGLAVVTWWPRGGGAVSEPRTLVTLDRGAIQEIEIIGRTVDDDAPDSLRLLKDGGVWIIDEFRGFPADPDRVSELLDNLLDLQVRAPVATQAPSHAALEVAEEAFTRKVRLVTGEQSVEVLLGAASGQQVNVRLASEPQVYTVRGFSAWSIADSARRYLDTDYVDAPREQVTQLVVENGQGTVALERTGDDTWIAAGLDDGQALDQAEVDRLLGRLLRLRIDEPVGTEREAAWGLDDGARVTWTVTEGGAASSYSYVVGAVEGGRAYVQRDDSPHIVKVFESSVKPALELKLEDLLEPSADEE